MRHVSMPGPNLTVRPGGRTGAAPILADSHPPREDLLASSLDRLFAPFAQGTCERPFVVAQLGQSLDGRIATVTGESKYINRGPALDHLHRIRARVDAVLVGVGTVVADDPLLTVRRVGGADPARVVIDPRGRAPMSARCLVDDGARRILIRRDPEGEAPPGVEALVLPCEAGETICPRTVVTALGRLGFRRILVEGGAHTISAFLDAGALDRLHLLVAPVLLGSGRPGLELRPIRNLTEARRPATEAHLLPNGEVLFDCDLRRSAEE